MAVTDLFPVSNWIKHLESDEQTMSFSPAKMAFESPSFKARASAASAEATYLFAELPWRRMFPDELLITHPKPPAQLELFQAASEKRWEAVTVVREWLVGEIESGMVGRIESFGEAVGFSAFE